MAKYLTSQRRELISFLSENPDRQFTPAEIFSNLEHKEISKSAVYRNLSALEAEGIVRRLMREGKRDSYYQYINHEVCRNSIHMICIKCGQTLHGPSDVINKMMDGVYAEQGFLIDKTKSVLYGLCSACN